MNNIEHKITGDKLVITVDISKKAIEDAPPSQSGKTFLVASTGAAVPLQSAHCRELRLTLNVMAKR